MKNTDIHINNCELFFYSFETRVPLKFGPETTLKVTSARAKITITSNRKTTEGWGETPLSVAWVWPSDISFEYRTQKLLEFTRLLCSQWNVCKYSGHAIEIGHQFIHQELTQMWKEFNKSFDESKKMPWLAALVCNSLFDIALHDAYGNIHETDTWSTYNKEYMNHDLSWYYVGEYAELFKGLYPQDFIIPTEMMPKKLPVWHLVGGKDAVTKADLTGSEPEDGYPVLLENWIKEDALQCLKVKLTGTDSEWDYKRLVETGEIAIKNGVLWLTADFNCTVHNPDYVNSILDRLILEQPRMYGMILYVEQPFPYEIERFPIDVHSVSAHKPLFMDESAHDWQFVAIGRKLGWTGVALKTCKTLTGAILSLCWAKKHGMTLMVQDLSNPMLAQIPHVLLAAHAGTIMGVESNGMQFYPKVSEDEARIHPGLYKRNDGTLDLSTLGKTGLGYRYNEIEKTRIAAGGTDKWVKA